MEHEKYNHKRQLFFFETFDILIIGVSGSGSGAMNGAPTQNSKPSLSKNGLSSPLGKFQPMPDHAFGAEVFIPSSARGVRFGAATARMSFEQFCEVKDPAGEYAYGVEVAVTEWLTNICRHGLPQSEEYQIEINLWAVRGTLHIVIRDNGTEFDPCKFTAEPCSIHPGSPDPGSLVAGGQGLNIIRSQFHMERIPDTLYSNALVLARSWPGPELEQRQAGVQP